MKEKTNKELLWEDYVKLKDRHSILIPCYEFGYSLIQWNVKMLMDNAPNHKLALETIRQATEEGIKWHVKEYALNNKGSNHE